MRRYTCGISWSKIVCALILSFVIVGCGSMGAGGSNESAVQASDAYDSYSEDEVVEEKATAGSETEPELATSALEAPEKMVYTADISLSSRNYDEVSAELDKRITQAGAIVFADSTWQNEWSDHVSRTRELTVRVAAEGLKSFVASLADIDSAKVTSKNIHASDKTKQYNDSQQRIELLQQEYDFYEKTVQETTDPETRLVYTERMFELLDEIRSLENNKAGIDQDVAYSEVSITLVEDTALSEHDGSTGLGQELLDAIAMIPSNIAAAFGYVLLFLIYALPFLLIVGLVVLAVVLIVRRHRARKPKKSRKQRGDDDRPAPPIDE